MKNQRLVIKVLREGKLLDRFDYPLDDLKRPIALPQGEPYQGYQIYLSTDGKGGYEFTPNGGETFIRFGDNHFGKTTEYFGVKVYTLLLRAYEGLRDEALDQEINTLKADVYDESLDDKENIERLEKMGGQEKLVALLKKRNLF